MLRRASDLHLLGIAGKQETEEHVKIRNHAGLFYLPLLCSPSIMDKAIVVLSSALVKPILLQLMIALSLNAAEWRIADKTRTVDGKT